MNDADNPYAAPEHGTSTPIVNPDQEWVCVGFWPRTLAWIIDTLIQGMMGFFLGLVLVFGISEKAADSALANVASTIIGAVFVLGFWFARNATPGKMVFQAEIRDARTLAKPSTGQFIGRYFAYIPSTLVFGLGFIWVAFEERKRGWHDLMAGTVVVRPRVSGDRPATRRVRRAPPPLRQVGQRAEDPGAPGT